jgi:hypothetical protein
MVLVARKGEIWTTTDWAGVLLFSRDFVRAEPRKEKPPGANPLIEPQKMGVRLDCAFGSAESDPHFLASWMSARGFFEKRRVKRTQEQMALGTFAETKVPRRAGAEPRLVVALQNRLRRFIKYFLNPSSMVRVAAWRQKHKIPLIIPAADHLDKNARHRPITRGPLGHPRGTR